MHNQALAAARFSFVPQLRPGDELAPVIRPAMLADAEPILQLVTPFAAEGKMLPRTVDQIALNIDNYVVATVAGAVVACAALEEYSPSLGEVSSVAVAPSHQGHGLGTQVVLGVERMARARNINELFALSLTERFFLALDYSVTSVLRYPEKLARYGTLRDRGVEVLPKPCFQKTLDSAWNGPQLV